ncbi:lysis protein [Pseudomonas sp. LS-2]|uniref:lysis protein n=1 Tax=Pseudomonas sp. LS-2 TaxID=2315859 RepID=UPI002113FFBA|nr:lysis protein [Pseudomonas sp. LS-2]
MIAALKLVPMWAWGVVVLVIALCVGSFAAAWFWQANAYGKVIATNESSYQSDRTLIANAASAQARDALAKQQEAEKKLAALDKTATEQKDKANAENETLRRAIADGTRRLRIAGTCSAGSGSSNVPKATGAAGVGNAGSVELSAATGRSVFDIRAGIIADQAALRAAQAYIRDVCQ